MKLSTDDKNKLVIAGTLLFIVAFVLLVFNTTRFLPLRLIAIIILVIEFILIIPYITKKYLALYSSSVGVCAYVPIVGSSVIFPKLVAILVLVNAAVVLISGFIAFMPAGILLKIMGEQAAMNFGGVAMSIMYVSAYALFFILGIGYCIVMHDVKRMVCAMTRAKCPLVELAYYPLLFLPVINLLGFVSLINYLGRLNRGGYKEFESKKDDDNLVEEVQ